MTERSPLVARPAAIVLCGGASRRMGRDKAWLDWHGREMLSHIAAVLRSCCDPLVVAAARSQSLPPLPKVTIVVRDSPAQSAGPLVAFSRGLEALSGRAERVFLVGCDMPLVDSGLVATLEVELQQAAAAVVRDEHGVHPLGGLYRTQLGATIHSLLAAGHRDLRALLAAAEVRYLDPRQSSRYARMRDVVRNLNTPGEYSAIRAASAE